MDVSYNELLKAKERLHFDEMSPKQKSRINLFQGSLTYKDKRLEGYQSEDLIEGIKIDLWLERFWMFLENKNLLL